MNIQDKPFLPIGGLCLDTEPVNQPDGTTRFALNVIHDSSEGSQGSINNEHSNQLCVDLDGKILGIINADRVNLFVFTENNTIYKVNTDECKAEVVITNNEFNFKNRITGTYRVIKGCEEVIYWREDGNPDRQLNLSKIKDYTNINTYAMAQEFNPPNVEAEVLETGGTLEYGTYFFILQYSDKNNNIANKTIPFGPVNVTGGLNIANALPDIGGKPPANKSIKLTISNIDNRYTAIKLGVIRYIASDGTTQSAHEVGDIIELGNNDGTIVFYYRGFVPANGDTDTISSLLTVPNVFYEQSKVMKQVQGRLVRANLLERTVDYSSYQKYASRIKTEWVYEDVFLDDMFDNNLRTEIGDEIKAYGIVYVFSNGELSPVFHIPGNHEVENTYINPVNYCKDDSYWGTTIQGDELLNTKVKHHKVPNRSEVPILSAERVVVTRPADRYWQLVPCGDYPVAAYTERKPIYTNERVQIANPEQIGVPTTVAWRYNMQTTNVDNPGYIPTSIFSTGYSNCTGTDKLPLPPDDWGVTYGAGKQSIRHIGVKFGNVSYPPNQNIIGHYFVTNVRTNSTKTVLQTGVVTPYAAQLDGQGNYVIYGRDNKNSKETNQQNFISADYLYLNDIPNKGTELNLYGNYDVKTLYYNFEQERQKNNPSIFGGFSELLGSDLETEFRIVSYLGDWHVVNDYESKPVFTTKIAESFSLQPQSNFKQYVNNSKNSKFNLLELEDILDESTGYHIPKNANLHYAAIKSNVPILTNLNTITYRIMDGKLYNAGDSPVIFSGDAFITPLNIVNIKQVEVDPIFLSKDGIILRYEFLQNVFTESIINTNYKVEGTTVCNNIYDYRSDYEYLSQADIIVSPTQTIKFWNNPLVIDAFLGTSSVLFRSGVLLEYLFNRIASVTDFSYRKFVLRDANNLCRAFYGYNLDWTVLTSSRQFRALNYYYDYCSECSNKYPNRVIWSEVSREEDLEDNYRVFKALSYFDIPADKGAITSFDYVDNVILLRTLQSSYILQPNPQQLQATGTTIAIGTGDFLSIPAQELISVPTGYGGQQDISAEVNTKFGLVWVDRQEGKVFLKPTGGGFEEISSYKMYHWFENNMNKGEVICTYDPRFERLILHNTNIDMGINKSFTLSYNLRTKTWISFHSYQPDVMSYTNNTFFSTTGNKIYAHNKYDTFTTFYDKNYPCIIEAVDTHFNTFNAHSVYYYAQVQRYDKQNNQWIPINDVTFDEAVFYNKLQSSGLIKLVVKDELQSLLWSNEEKPVSIKDKNSRISQLRDIAISSPVMTNDWNYTKEYYNDKQGYIDKVPLPTSIDYSKEQYQLNEFSDKYIQLRFIFNNNSNKITIHLMDINKFASLR